MAFSGTTVIVNGGASYSVNQADGETGNAAVYIDAGIMSDIRNVDLTKLDQDNALGPVIIDHLATSEQGWASYDMSSHILSPIAVKDIGFQNS